MSQQLIIKIVGSMALAFASFYVVKTLVNSKEKLMTPFNFCSTLLLILPTWLLTDVKYNSLVLIIYYILSILIHEKIFKISRETAILACSMNIALICITDLIVATIEMQFLTYEQMRVMWYMIIINNILISISAVLLSKLKFIRSKFQVLCKKVNDNRTASTAIFGILLVVIISLLYQNLAVIFKLDMYYTITLLSMFVFFALYYFYLEEKNNYQQLHDEYSILYDYVQEFEDWIDDEQMQRHELKNKLAMLKGLTKNKKVNDAIDELLKMTIVIDDHYIEQLSTIPKGGLKGIIYYKIAIAKKAEVKIFTEASSSITEHIQNMPADEMKKIATLIGIYLDNAIEAASKSEKKVVTLELYMLEDKLQIIISNTYKDLIPLEKMRQKGFSTKGKGHGKGVYYAEKVIKKSKSISSEDKYLNDYYIRKIVVN